MSTPFGQMKDLYKMQKKAKQMQNKLREKVLSGESKDGLVRVHLNAAQEFVDMFIDESLLSPEQVDKIYQDFKEAFKDYQKKLQKEMAKDFDLDSIKGMLGN